MQNGKDRIYKTCVQHCKSSHSYYLYMQYKMAVFANVCSNCWLGKVQHHRACGRLLLFAKTVTANSSSLN